MSNVSAVVKSMMLRNGIKSLSKLDKRTIYYLMGEEFKLIQKEMINIYGSASNYKRVWLKNRGMKAIEYQDWIAQMQGFKNQKEYLDEKYHAKGFKDKADRDRFYRVRKKYHKSISDFEVREIQLKKEKKREFKKELQDFIIIRKSMRLNKMKKNMSCEVGVVTSTPIATRGRETSTHPTIGVCSKQNKVGLNREINPSNGEISMSSARMPTYMAGN